jgi:hypothetical protein
MSRSTSAMQLAPEEPQLVSKLVPLSSLPPGPDATLPPAHVSHVLSGGSSGHFDRVIGVLFPTSALLRARG